MVNVAILGHGTIGSGVYKVINDNNSHVSRRAGDDIKVKYVLDLRDFPGDPVEDILVHDFDTILNDDEVDIVVEAMGGVEPAHTYAMQALLAGKSVCTSNKEVVAKYGYELIQIAKENNCNFFFEASVGGGIPIIRPLMGCITADHIKSISGILNGTTNYILTKMSEEGLAFDDVLKDAQNKGYAERNPEADIEGYDACRKIAILASLAYERQVNFEDIYTEGITKITCEDFWYANQLHSSIEYTHETSTLQVSSLPLALLPSRSQLQHHFPREPLLTSPPSNTAISSPSHTPNTLSNSLWGHLIQS